MFIPLWFIVYTIVFVMGGFYVYAIKGTCGISKQDKLLILLSVVLTLILILLVGVMILGYNPSVLLIGSA